MLRAIFDRLFGRGARAAKTAAVPTAAAPAPAARSRPVSPAAPTEVPLGLGAGRPLVATSGALGGFEFSVGAAVLARLRGRADDTAMRACVVNLLGAMRYCIEQKLIALAEVPASLLVKCASGEFCSGMYLILGADALFSDATASAALIARLRGAGVRVGWRPPATEGDALPAVRPDFVAIRLSESADATAWRQAIEAAAKRWRDVPQVLLDVGGVDLMESMLHTPVAFAACIVGKNIAPASAQTLPPQTQRLLQLMNRLVRDDDNALLVADIKADAALALSLLRYLNSAGANPGRELDSIDQAVLVLGRDALYRWVANMLVRLAPPRPAADPLRALALARARLLELLARDRGEASPGSLYLLGLASMLPVLMRCSVDDATGALQLPPAAMQALRDGTGPWHPYLALAEALERHDMATAESLAGPFGGLEQVLHRSAKAWMPK